MQTVFEAAQPRADVLSGELRDEMFAASLEEVISGRGELVYRDPTTFFANTFPTAGLQALLTQALGRIAGRLADPIIRLETAFGGGKTHSLIALYHLAQGHRLIGVERYVDPALLPGRPIRVAAVVGNALEPSHGVRHPDATAFTLWGELAHRLGAFDQVARSDRQKIAPGVGTLAKVFEGAPVIVMLDEMARYLEVASGVKVGESTLADQTVAFLMALLEYAASVNHVVVVYTLAGSADAFAAQTEKLLEKIGALKDAEAVSSRHEHVISPTGENEISAIVRHRLFERVDSEAASQTARSYHRAIVDQLDREADIPPHSGQAGYARDIEQSYPFHPELLTGLNEKVSTIPNFQKTRGALRLLSRVVRKLWRERPADTFLIHPHHVDLSSEKIANDLTSRLGRAVFKQVIEADIVNPMAGAKAHAALVDEDLIQSGKPAYANRIATTVFLHSLTQGVASGVSPAKAKLAAFTPGDDLGLIERQTDKLLDRAFYFHADATRYRFSTEPSLAAVITQEKQLVGRASAKAELDRRIRTIWKKSAFSPVFFPAEPSDIDDRFDTPRLAVLHYDAAAVQSPDIEPPPPILHLLDRAGTAGGFRVFRNQLVFLCADHGQLNHTVEEARRYLAINRITADQQRLSQFTPDNRKKLKGRADEAELTLRVAITRLYKHLFYPDATAPKKHGQLASAVLPAQQQGNVQQDQTQVVVGYLRELGKVRTAHDPGLAPAYLRQKAWPSIALRVTPRQLQKECASRIGVPILLDINSLKDAIRDGIRAGTWRYYDPRQECAYSSESPTSPLIEITDDVELILPEAAGSIPICGQEEPPPPIGKCPVCRQPQDQCSCGEVRPATSVIKSAGTAAQVFQRVADLATDHGVKGFSDLHLAIAGSGPDFLQDLSAIALAVPQFPKSEIEVEVEASFDLPDARLRVEYQGPWVGWREIGNTTNRAALNALQSSGRLGLRLLFPNPVAPDGPEMSAIRDVLVRLNTGRVTVIASPDDNSS